MFIKFVHSLLSSVLITFLLSSSSVGYTNCSSRPYGYRYPYGYDLSANYRIQDSYYREYNDYVTKCRSQYYNCLYGPPYGTSASLPYPSSVNVYPIYNPSYSGQSTAVTGSFPYYYGSSYYGYPTNQYWCLPCGVYYCKCQVIPSYPNYPPPKPKPERQEPIFLGRGMVRIVDGKDAELTCYFSDPRYKIVSNAAWVKVIGQYDYWRQTPPFECFDRCTYTYINSIEDFRYRVITMGQTSILRIYNWQNGDYGIYRCTATGLGVDGSTVTLYQVIEFVGANKK
ncbi:hypothetical protein B4U80_12881 [Leptotrombidium deliense]|uniref:Ig-like domain-containing protein n=1 Tax=Leptotrombidium deliense TaxID=299467 RepID=A0A443SIC6_9ACAR|nr:hypothetical protein B4U80_12881 [Leptotrombidium deliense]